jgi:hypothetical protein
MSEHVVPRATHLPDQWMTNETPQPNANIRRQSCKGITVFVDFSGEGSALITAWLEVRVLPGPPLIFYLFDLACASRKKSH